MSGGRFVSWPTRCYTTIGARPHTLAVGAILTVTRDLREAICLAQKDPYRSPTSSIATSMAAAVNSWLVASMPSVWSMPTAGARFPT